MAFNPSSTIWLCNVPFDNSYKNVVYFYGRASQQTYFLGKTVERVTEYLTVRKTLPDGNLRSSVKVGFNIDYLRSKGCNYMWYCNAHHGERKFYAFITELIYINEETTELVFETDVYQTWFLDCELLESFVEREHSATDDIGDNIVPENFDFQDYTYAKLESDVATNEFGYLVAATNPVGTDNKSRGRLHSGIYQGLYFYYFESPNEINSFIDTLEEEKEDAVVSITVVPKYIRLSSVVDDDGYVQSSTNVTKTSISFDISSHTFFWNNDGTKFNPKNKKLFTAPFFTLYATNNNGQQVDYKLEDFATPLSPSFEINGDLSIAPSITYVPKVYKSIEKATEFGITTGTFPQCSFNSDTFKLWLSKNELSLKYSIGTGVASMALGLGAAAASAFVPGLLPVGVAAVANAARVGVGLHQAASGMDSMISTINGIRAASFEPNKVNAGSQTNNLLTAMGENKVSFYVKRVKTFFAKMVDDFFTMYGYQVNRVKKPNLNVREAFTYVKTQNVNIAGGIPNDDMLKLKSVFDNGVTIWLDYVKIGDYSVDNSCVPQEYPGE